jgi:hypothetical protein
MLGTFDIILGHTWNRYAVVMEIWEWNEMPEQVLELSGHTSIRILTTYFNVQMLPLT